MIKCVYIFNELGSPLFHRIYGSQKSKIDDALFSGLISAMILFAKEKTKQNLKIIEFDNSCIYFDRRDSSIVAIITPKRMDDNLIKEISDTILNDFYDQFNTFLDDSFDPMTNALFMPFKDTIDTLLTNRGLIIKSTRRHKKKLKR